MNYKKGILAIFILGMMLCCFSACKNAEKTSGNGETATNTLSGEQAAALLNNLGQGLDVLIAAQNFDTQSADDDTIVAFAMTQQKCSYARQLEQGVIDQNTYDMLTLQYFNYEIDAAANKYFGQKPSSYSTKYSSFSSENDSLREKDWPFSGTTCVVTQKIEALNGLYVAEFSVYHVEEEQAPEQDALARGEFDSNYIGTINAKFSVYGTEEKYPVFSTFSFIKNKTD